MESLSLLGMLGVCAWEDIKRRQIRLFLVLSFGLLGVLMHIISPTIGIWDLLGGMGVGGALFAISILTGEKIGKGDALLITVTGIYLGFTDNMLLLWASSFIVGIVGMVLFIRKKRDARIPFVPFVLAVYIVMLITKGGAVVS